MQRRRSADTQKNLDELEENPQLTARQQTRIVTTYTKKVPLDEAEEMEPDDIEEEEREESGTDADPIALLLSQMGADQGQWSLVIQRLPNYEKDQRSDPHAKSIYCGKLPLTQETLESGDYKAEIQSRWARPNKSNHFRVQVRRINRVYGYLPVESLEPAEPEVIAKQEASEQPIYLNMPPAPQETFAGFMKQVEQVAKLRTLLVGEMPPLAAPSPAQTAATNVNTTEGALIHLLSTDETFLESAIGKFRGLVTRAENGARETGFIDLVMAAIQNDTLPKMIKEAKALWMEVQHVPPQMGAPPVAPMQHHQNFDAQGQMDQTATPGSNGGAAFHPPAQAVPPAEIAMLQFAVNACAQNMPPAAASAWIIEFEQQNPGTTPFITAFLAMPAADALNWLAQTIPQAASITEMPHAAAWIDQLQTALRMPEEGEEANAEK